jgi:hypothetical protein
MTVLEAPRPRGGIIVTVKEYGSQGQYTAIWCIDPKTLAERVMTVWTTEHKPAPHDELWWHPAHSPAWIPYGTVNYRVFLPRCGKSFDPLTRTPSQAL